MQRFTLSTMASLAFLAVALAGTPVLAHGGGHGGGGHGGGGHGAGHAGGFHGGGGGGFRGGGGGFHGGGFHGGGHPAAPRSFSAPRAPAMRAPAIAAPRVQNFSGGRGFPSHPGNMAGRAPAVGRPPMAGMGGNRGFANPGLAGVNRGLVNPGFAGINRSFGNPGVVAPNRGPGRPAVGAVNRGITNPGLASVNRGFGNPGLAGINRGFGNPGLAGVNRGPGNAGFGGVNRSFGNAGFAGGTRVNNVNNLNQTYVASNRTTLNTLNNWGYGGYGRGYGGHGNGYRGYGRSYGGYGAYSRGYGGLGYGGYGYGGLGYGGLGYGLGGYGFPLGFLLGYGLGGFGYGGLGYGLGGLGYGGLGYGGLGYGGYGYGGYGYGGLGYGGYGGYGLGGYGGYPLGYGYAGAGYGPSGWLYGGSLYDYGYLPYSNPYYASYAPSGLLSAPYDYAQPISSVTVLTSASATDGALAVFGSARDSFKQGNFALALQQADSALAGNPGDTSLHEFRALCLFALGRYDEAATVLYAVLSAGPGWDWPTLIGLYPNVSVYNAQVHALEDFCRANPPSSSGRFVLAYHYLTQGHLDDAANMFRQVVALKPNDTLSATLLKPLQPAQQNPAGAAGSQPLPPPNPEPAEVSPAGANTVLPEGATIAGTWTAQPNPETSVTLTIEPGGAFTWRVNRKGQPHEFSGTSTFGGGILTLVAEKSPPIVGRVTWTDPEHINFRVVGDRPDADGLNFSR